eukprot:TRINITY_DN21645_c0_g1_i12.p1 TRINITY_DN21645_c0_g1~~TRINITY_DN21645_c0_g1_i12.p1  ORF type:complete len:152 (-),score=5.87 TRINITY_DN21645_c0_g1_i12:32-487(-)
MYIYLREACNFSDYYYFFGFYFYVLSFYNFEQFKSLKVFIYQTILGDDCLGNLGCESNFIIATIYLRGIRMHGDNFLALFSALFVGGDFCRFNLSFSDLSARIQALRTLLDQPVMVNVEDVEIICFRFFVCDFKQRMSQSITDFSLLPFQG